MTNDQLAARLERLERSHARVKRLATALGLMLAATFAGAMHEDQVPDVIRANRLEIVDSDDETVLIELGEGPYRVGGNVFPDLPDVSGGTIRVLRADGVSGIVLHADGLGGDISVKNGNGNPGAWIQGGAADGVGGTVAVGLNGGARASLFYLPGGGQMWLHNDEGDACCRILSGEMGGVMALGGETPRAVLSGADATELQLLRADGRPLTRIGVNDAGDAGRVVTLDADGAEVFVSNP